ncbi:hypothetical protein SRABI106_03311 [Rahnella aquatilis]|nr:hypothetical protein SRABI106_03311 [Rahnella aquatilis]
MLAQFDLRLFAVLHFEFQLIDHCQTRFFRFHTVGDFLIQLGDVVFELLIQFEVAVAHFFQFIDQTR